MVRPSSALSARLRLTTKQVNGGYYKGNRTGSMGAHTEWGGYVIDYRKVRNYNCPDLADNRLMPFVTAQIEPPKTDKNKRDRPQYLSAHGNGKLFIEAWKDQNPIEYEEKKEEWTSYLQEIGDLPVMPTPRPTRGTPHINKGAAEPRRMEDDVYIQAREAAVAQIEDSSRSKPWLGRVFKR